MHQVSAVSKVVIEGLFPNNIVYGRKCSMQNIFHDTDRKMVAIFHH